MGVPLHTHDHHLPPLISTPFKGCRRGCSPQLLPHSRSSPRKPPPWVGYHNREPGRFTEVDPSDVCVVRKPVSDEPFSHLASRPQAYQNSKLLRHLDIERDELISREGSVSPMCGCNLHLGSPHKNSDLGRCSTRQPTVYSYTASHRSPCIRVDSPTPFHQHQHDHYHPDSHNSNNIVSL